MAGLIEPNQIGKREDLSDLIASADMKATPFTSMAPKGKKPGNMLMTWQQDDELAVDTDGIKDGVDYTAFENAAENRATCSVYAQKYGAAGKIGDLAENVSDVAGIPAGEMSRTVKKLLTKVKRSMEAKFLSDDDTQAEGAAGAYENRGMGSWLQNAAQGVLPVDSNFRTPTASIDATASTAAATEAAINDVLESIYSETGEDKDFQCFVGAKMRKRISDLQLYDPNIAAGTAQIVARHVNKDQKDSVIHKKIDVVRGDFGTLHLHTDQFMGYVGNTRTAAVGDGRMYILDMKDILLRFARSPGFTQLPDLGGGPRGYVDAIGGLLVGNPLKHGAFKPTAN